MKKRYLIILILVISSCSAFKGFKCNFSSTCYTIFREGNNSSFTSFSNENKTNFSFEDYNTYVLSLCEDSSFLKEGQIEDLPYPVIENCRTNTSKKIIEQNYLLYPKKDGDKNVIYITSFSHKYIDPDCGVFNCKEFRNKYFIEDIDYVYIGTLDDANNITFSSKNEGASTWAIKANKDSIILKSISLPSISGKPRNNLNLEKIFATDLVFYKEEMELQYGKSAYSECFQGSEGKDFGDSNCSIVIPPKSVGKNTKSQATDIFLMSDNLVFMTNKEGIKEFYMFNINKVK